MDNHTIDAIDNSRLLVAVIIEVMRMKHRGVVGWGHKEAATCRGLWRLEWSQMVINTTHFMWRLAVAHSVSYARAGTHTIPGSHRSQQRVTRWSRKLVVSPVLLSRYSMSF
jgi:hypothetical protein